MIIAILFVIGLCVGSFVNAYVWRVYKQETGHGKGKQKKAPAKYSILHGRSMCPHCEHQLHAKDLVPVLSWLSLKGKCRYCKKPISPQYPLVELLTAVLFVVSYIAWPLLMNIEQWVYLGLWLVSVAVMMALAIYDLKWMILPNRMVAVLLSLALVQLLVAVIWQQSLAPLMTALWGALIGGGLFYVLFQLSAGRWIGGGDVKLGAVLGLIVGGPMNGILLLFIASFMGTLVAVPLLALGKAERTSKLPFGPYLLLAAYVVYLFGSRLVDWYNQSFFIV